MKDMYIGEKPKKNYLSHLLVILMFCVVFAGYIFYTQNKEDKAHLTGFVEGCMSVAVLTTLNLTGQPPEANKLPLIEQSCLMLYKDSH